MHRRLVYIYLLNVPSFYSLYFNEIKRMSRLGRLLALSLEILSHLVFLYVPWLNDTYNNSTATEKTSLVICNNKGPDQPAHPRSLISNCVVCFLRRIIPRLASCEIISTFYLACLADGTGLSETQKTGFLA